MKPLCGAVFLFPHDRKRAETRSIAGAWETGVAGDDAPLVTATYPHVGDQKVGVPSTTLNPSLPLQPAAQDGSRVEYLRDAIVDTIRNELNTIQVGDVIGFGELLPTRSPRDQSELVIQDIVQSPRVTTLKSEHPLAFARKDLLVVHDKMKGTSDAIRDLARSPAK